MKAGSTRRRAVWVAIWLGVSLVAGWWLSAGRTLAGPSSLSQGAEGWFLARAYLAARGVEVETLAAPLADRAAVREDESRKETWILAFPWQQGVLGFDPEVVRDHATAGGTVLLGYSNGGRPGRAEARLLSVLIDSDAVERVPVSLAPLTWWEEHRGEEELSPTFRAEPLTVRSMRWYPRPPSEAETLFRSEDGKPIVSRWSVGEGEVVAMPAELLANGRILGSPFGPSWLETLARLLPEPWVFDEYHHGAIDPALAAAGGVNRTALDRLVLQVALVYLVFVWAASRRMGPAWREAQPIASQADSFLLGLGRLHHRKGHHAEAAQLLLERAEALDPRVEIDDTLRRRAQSADAAELIALCNSLEGRSV